MAKNTPAELAERIRALHEEKKEAELEIQGAVAEARAEIRERIADLLSKMAVDPIQESSFRVREVVRAGKWIFEFSFTKADADHNPEIAQALADIKAYESAVSINVIEKE